ncbi:protein NEL-like isoform X2 [Haliotis rufescens]|uniref:protein NEL-like isoform X2 n=1 Tax=Haliotis rufescens TaxID=6454 RepID=UPI00201F4664|nr:protein NEL-like isoform X2 [Haliotis rufescens]
MDKGAVDITERSEKGKNMLLLRVQLCLPFLVLTCWAVLNGVSGSCSVDGDCQHSGTCDTTNKICDCTNTGYDGDTCENDIDECTDGTHNCHANADCTNTDGSFTCKCKDGHAGDGVKCTDCTENGNECLNDGTCDIPSGETAGTCLCKTGYSGRICEDDIDECTDGTHNCHANADCTNTDGSFTCKCKDGYDGDGVKCTDCTVNGNECLNDGTCDIPPGETDGTCSCKNGYSGPLCADDIDECTDGTHNCHAKADCTNTDGSFTCKCKDGYDGDGVKCTDCTVNGNECLNDGICDIPPGETDGTCSCKNGYSGSLCADDIDECTDGTDNCHENSDCTNTDGSFTCTCKAGHVGDGVECEPSGAATVSVHFLLLIVVAVLAKLCLN